MNNIHLITLINKLFLYRNDFEERTKMKNIERSSNLINIDLSLVESFICEMS